MENQQEILAKIREQLSVMATQTEPNQPKEEPAHQQDDAEPQPTYEITAVDHMNSAMLSSLKNQIDLGAFKLPVFDDQSSGEEEW